MPALIDKVRGSAGKALWIDYAQYAGRLLTGGQIPWLDTAACVAWQRKAQGLLRSDVVALPVGRVASGWLEAHPALLEAMAARSRAVYPLKTLLADADLRLHLVALFGALRASVPTVLALSVPSPRAWVAEAYRQAHDDDTKVGEDEADSAALYIADFVRSFGEAGADALELVESGASEPASAAEIACYQSVVNVARHYRWDVGLRVPGARYDGQAAGLDFIISPGAVHETVHGQVVPASFWTDGTASPAPVGGFRYLVVPADCGPEQVLERLASLR